jgi:hypothetical protein
MIKLLDIVLKKYLVPPFQRLFSKTRISKYYIPLFQRFSKTRILKSAFLIEFYN